ncbi:unannotated protein [freshwater metagenome]|uniref:Unannotated protein n=1 Tax=freshwater metagenome TaxID=449393 RepID=A0A6J6B6V0_9ZZZZ|nr:hypothetical protein [Actinomycetota bacterium]MTA05548.1 hypothetical protein [Actinomycetota bacterium]MTA38314.1 hypothetical protein [Actinomycetota bacterium]
MARSDKTRPAELVGLASVAGLFLGGIVLMVTRDFALSAIAGGGGFVITIISLAMMVLAMSPQLPKSDNNPHD